MVLSKDLRQRIVDLVRSGVSRREAARRFQVSASSAIRFVKQYSTLGPVVSVERPPPSKAD
ncbi:MAG: helix-turn-helix domain-containing protein [Kordiimonadaceae bacterium]|nr:helix-turn-helix domain-containing protein [Kordiimonadaceae bacterium]